jgi:tryptophanase
MKTVSFKTLGFSLLIAASAVIIPTAVENRYTSEAVAQVEYLADVLDSYVMDTTEVQHKGAGILF